MSRKTQNILALCAGVLGLFLAIGVRTFLRPCVHEDGSLAACTGAGDWIFWLGIALALTACLQTWLKGLPRRLVLGVVVILSLGIILAPGVLSPVCGMAQMRCRMVTQPAARVAGSLALVLSAVALVGALRKKGE